MQNAEPDTRQDDGATHDAPSSSSKRAAEDPRSGFGEVFDDMKMDVQETIGRLTNDPRYGAHGAEPGAVLPEAHPETLPAAPKGAREASIDKLQDCLRGELSAVDAYNLAIRSVKDVEVATVLRQLRDSHDGRVYSIRDEIRHRGAIAQTDSGAWGTFAKLVQGGADFFGDKAALAALEEGEDHGLKLYGEDHADCDVATRDFIATKLFPEQRRSHDLCRSLKRFAKQI